MKETKLKKKEIINKERLIEEAEAIWNILTERGLKEMEIELILYQLISLINARSIRKTLECEMRETVKKVGYMKKEFLKELKGEKE